MIEELRKYTDECTELFNNGSTTKEVQDFLMKKTNCERSKTSNFIKKLRIKMGKYKRIPLNSGANKPVSA